METDTFEYFIGGFDETWVINHLGELDVSQMAGTFLEISETGLADDTTASDSHTGVVDAVLRWKGCLFVID